MNKENYTSLELSRKLFYNECDLESEYCWIQIFFNKNDLNYSCNKHRKEKELIMSNLELPNFQKFITNNKNV